MKTKAQLKTIVFLLAAAILVVGTIITFSNPTITGFATSGPKVSQDVIDKINADGQANVIVVLKDDSIKHLTNKEKKAKIKQNQEKVLSKIDYIDAKQKEQARKQNKQISQLLKTKDFDLKYAYSFVNAFAGNLTSQGLRKLQSNPDVEQIILVKKIKASLDVSVPLINADDVWGIKIKSKNITGRGQSICILDTGVDYTHESLGGCTLVNVTEHTCKVIAGYDFVNVDTNPLDDNDHGTHVAGIAAGNGTVLGVAREAKIVAIKVLDSAGEGGNDDLLAGVSWCVNNATKFNISAISMSLGDELAHTSADCPTTADSSLQSAISSNISVFAASGNDYFNTGINWPACSPYAMSVGASNDDDEMASFTDISSLLDIVAPGVGIISALRGGGTTSGDGTSMATPHAAGAAALISQYERELNKKPAKQDEVEVLLGRSNITISDSGLSFPRIDVLRAINDILLLNSSENSAKGNQIKIKFLKAINLENVSEAFLTGHNFIDLNSSKYERYNVSANITFYNVSYNKTPIIYSNGVVCTDCVVLRHSDVNVTFNVTHFTNYTSSANSEIDIYDQRDAKGGSIVAKSNIQTTFYTNYSNKTSNEEVSTGNCTIKFPGLYKNMTYDAASELFKFNRTFFLSKYYRYNVSCSHYRFESLNTTDTIFISPACLNQTPNADITIVSGENSNCTGETITLINQSIRVYGTLLLNNTELKLNITGTTVDSLNVSSRGNLTIINSTIIGAEKPGFIYSNNFSKLSAESSRFTNVTIDVRNNATSTFTDCYLFSTINLRGDSNNTFINTTFNHTSEKITTLGNSNNIFNHSKFYLDLSCEGSSINTIKKSNILKNVSFLDNSYSEIKNTSINEIKQLGPGSVANTVVLNFTNPRSNIRKITLFKFNSKIYGYVNMSSTAGYFAVMTVKRFYPVQVNYTDRNPAPNKLVNVTNATTGTATWAGYTNAKGFANPNITFTAKNKAYNYTVKINPELNISLLSDTPLNFTITDTTQPAISKINHSGITNISAVINWTTDESANTSVLYGTTVKLGSKRRVNNAVTEHNVTLLSLTNHTRYFYNVSSCDPRGNCATNGTFNFITGQTPAVISSSSVHHGGGGGGSGSAAVCTSAWVCDMWQECVNNQRTRICEDSNGCAAAKTEVQSCVMKETKPPEEIKQQSPLIITGEEIKQAAIIEAPKPFFLQYDFLLWFVFALFILIILAQRIETFPWILWRDKKYLEKHDLGRAEKLYDRLINRFAKSKKLEKKYIREVELLSLEIDKEEIEEKEKISTKESLSQYKEVLEKYLAMHPDQRKELEQKLIELRSRLLR